MMMLISDASDLVALAGQAGRRPCRSRPMRMLALLLTAMLLAGPVLIGCQPKSSAGKQFSLSGEGTPEASWPFWPRAMRIHPLTRFTDDPRNPDQVLIETRIEFTDAWKDPCKALGIITLDLADGADATRYDPELDRYQIDLRDLDINVERWDPVTRTYVFKLEVSRFRIPQRPQLIVMFDSADGGRAEDRANVRPYEP